MIRKELVAASAEPLILSLLANGESYGYAIIQEVKARSGGKLQWTDGMLYPVLHRLENRGLIKARWGESETGRKRKYYSLEKDGKTAMAKHHEQWTLIHGVLSGLRPAHPPAAARALDVGCSMLDVGCFPFFILN